MSTLQDLWSDYWWVLPVGLMLFCVLGCVLGCILGARRGRAGCRRYRAGDRWRRPRCC